MSKELYIDVERFKKGFYALEDTTKAPIGSLRIMKNATVTDRGGIGPRPGTELLGSYDNSGSKIKGFYNFRKSFSTNELLVKAIGTTLETYSNDHSSSGWFTMKDGFTTSKEFGFVSSLVNTDNADFMIGGNRYEDYFRWQGDVTLLDGAVTGSPSVVTVDSVLTAEIFHSDTATSATSTTVDVAGTPWAPSQWLGLYIYITSGTHNGKIRAITANDNNTLTFDTLGSTPGTATFEVRKNAFPATGTLIYGGTELAYTAIPTATTFTVSSAHDGADNLPVTIVPTLYPANPRGNRFTNYLNRIIVGNVRSAMARNTGGTLSGYSSAGSYFVSAVSTPTDFTFTATRVAGEGDIVSAPYGGGDITDVAHHENDAYVFKKEYIEAVQYSQDENDLAVRDPLKAGVGSIGKTTKGSNDIYFFTGDKRFTSIGRVRAKDLRPEIENIGFPIQRYLNGSGIDSTVGRGREYRDKLYLPIKSTSSQTDNDVVLVYSRINKSFEGIWDIPAFGIEEFAGDLVYGESNGANSYKMLTGTADVVGTTRYPIFSEVATHFMNLTASKANVQALNSVYFEGYIRGGTTVTFNSWKDFASDPFLSFTLASTEEGLLDGENTQVFLGGKPLGGEPLGAISGEVDDDGRRHFQFRVYFPFEYGNYFSIGHTSTGADHDYEVIRYGLALKEETAVNTGRIKSI